MAEREPTLFTIGHSTHELAEFLRLLNVHGVEAVADVRSQPVSRLTHFDRDELADALGAEGIEYVFLGRELGARRDEPECYEDGQAVYERIAELPAFREGLARVIQRVGQQRLALMCAEKEPLDCHRMILVCRHLRNQGIAIRHILADGEAEDHAAAQRRLLRLTKEERTLFEPDVTEEELLGRAYEKRGRQIAYRMCAEGDSP
jgi:uncharacterized protein (DUF488 family)